MKIENYFYKCYYCNKKKMKILLFTLFLLTFIHAKSISLLLPHQYDTAMHQLSSHLINAKSDVTIVTPYLQSYTIKKTLLLLLKNDIPITLITSSQNHMGTNLVQYKNVELHLLKNTKLNFSLIIIDNKFTCKLPSALDEKSMKSNLSFFECSSVKYVIKDSKKILKSIMPYAVPYLKEDF